MAGDDDFGRRFRAFYDDCSSAEKEFLRALGSLADDTWGELPESAEVEGFTRIRRSSFADGMDSLAEMGEQQQLRMQMYMDRMSKADAAASNTMKKWSQLSSQIISNLK